MPWKLTIRIGELLVTATLAISIIAAWRAERADRAQLAAELAAPKQSLTQADDRQHARDSQLLQTLATLAADKRSVTSPEQIIRELPQYLSLPAPITLQSTTQSQSALKPGTSENGTSENNADPGTANSHSSPKNSPKRPTTDPSRNPCRRPQASLRLHPGLQGLPNQTGRRPGRPDRRKDQDRHPDQRTRRSRPHRQRRKPPASHSPRGQMVRHRCRSRSHRRPRRTLAMRWTPATKRGIQHRIVVSKCRTNQQTAQFGRWTGAPPAPVRREEEPALAAHQEKNASKNNALK